MSMPSLLWLPEAGDDSTQETLTGFPWSLRLRTVMETVHNLQEAVAFWRSTNNTMGINHGIGSSVDKQFLALETNAVYTAYFHANDSREANYVVDGVHLGFPMAEALWRTNHGYDPVFLETAVGHISNTSDSFVRYMLIHDTLVQYSDDSVAIADLQAVNITAVGTSLSLSLSFSLACMHSSPL